VWLSITVLSVANLILTILARNDLATTDAVSGLIYSPAPVLYATLGALIVRRAGNVIGWMLIGIGGALAINSLASVYAVFGVAHPGTLSAPELVGLLAEWSFIPVFTGIGFMLLLFPSGTLPSRRWRPWAVLGLLATGCQAAALLATAITGDASNRKITHLSGQAAASGAASAEPGRGGAVVRLPG
jgi:hypothetical protein